MKVWSVECVVCVVHSMEDELELQMKLLTEPK
jgi:hypothetical protein